MTNDWKKAFFEMAQVVFENTTEESGLDDIFAVLREREDQEAVIDFLEQIYNSEVFPEETDKRIIAYFIEKAKEGVKAKKELQDFLVERQIEEIKERETSKAGILGLKVRDIAERTITANAGYYSAALLQLIPKELLDVELTDNNLHELGKKIDETRFKKEDELATMLQMVKPDEKDMQKLREVINGTREMAGEFTLSQKEKIKEIKFLSNVAQIIIHQ